MNTSYPLSSSAPFADRLMQERGISLEDVYSLDEFKACVAEHLNECDEDSRLAHVHKFEHAIGCLSGADALMGHSDGDSGGHYRTEVLKLRADIEAMIERMDGIRETISTPEGYASIGS